MKDWKGIAKAAGIDIPAADMDRITGPLNTLEESFRPLVKNLPPELEPVLTFSADEESK